MPIGVLDKSDLVMIDPVGTGLSHAVCNHHDEEFWGVDPGHRLHQPLHRTVRERQRSLDLAEVPARGELRDDPRAAILNYLRGKRSMEFNGLILVSVATDIEAIFAELPGNDRPYAVYLPGYAAVAWYHHALPNAPAALEPFLPRCAPMPPGPTPQALLKGDALPDAELEAAARSCMTTPACRWST